MHIFMEAKEANLSIVQQTVRPFLCVCMRGCVCVCVCVCVGGGDCPMDLEISRENGGIIEKNYLGTNSPNSRDGLHWIQSSQGLCT
jgi:hypothetical protein